jgi:hypothetical protein
MSVLSLNLVVKSADRDAAVKRYSALLESNFLNEFEMAERGLTVTVFPGLSVVSGTKEALSRLDSLVASAFVDSIEATEVQLVEAGWTVGGSLGSPKSFLARDPDGSTFEFVERPDHAE